MLSRTLPIVALALAIPSLASAEADKRQHAPKLELVDVFTNTGQALVYDQVEAQYVLLRIGSQHRGIKVGSLSASQIEVYRIKNARTRYVLSKPKTAAPTATDGPLDPYASAPVSAPATPEPVAEEPPSKVKIVRAPVASRPTQAPGKAIVSRKELNAALDDLDSLSREVDLELIKEGTRVKAVGEGTLPHRLGLRTGDIILSVAGVRTTRLEDGADVFVRLSSAKKFEIKLLRNDEPLSISVAVQ